MKAKQLIRELSDLTLRHGNVEVYRDADGIPMPVTGISVVPFSPGETAFIIGERRDDRISGAPDACAEP